MKPSRLQLFWGGINMDTKNVIKNDSELVLDYDKEIVGSKKTKERYSVSPCTSQHCEII